MEAEGPKAAEGAKSAETESVEAKTADGQVKVEVEVKTTT